MQEIIVKEDSSIEPALAAAYVKIEDLPEVECPLEHEFAHGACIRKMYIPAGTAVLGKKHRHRVYNILLFGEGIIYAGDGKPPKLMKAPYEFICEAGSQKLGIFHKDSLWINVLPTFEKDIDKIEKEFIIEQNREEIRMMGEKILSQIRNERINSIWFLDYQQQK